MKLLTKEEVAEQLKIKPRTVMGLGLPVVKVGKGKGVLRYRQEDIDRYILSKLVYDSEDDAGNRVSKRPQKVGLQGLPSRAHLQAVRVASQGRG